MYNAPASVVESTTKRWGGDLWLGGIEGWVSGMRLELDMGVLSWEMSYRRRWR